MALGTVVVGLLTAFIFHSYCSQAANQINFMKNLSISGGYLLLAVLGAGYFSIDRILNKKW